LDIIDNAENIIKSLGVGDGGASGEFFYFSNDNKLILKTIS
jgi:hypothetical protein